MATKQSNPFRVRRPVLAKPFRVRRPVLAKPIIAKPAPRRMEQSIFHSIVQMANEMNRAEKVKRFTDYVHRVFTDKLTNAMNNDDDDDPFAETIVIDEGDIEHDKINVIDFRITHYQQEKLIEVNTEIVGEYPGVGVVDEDDYSYDTDSEYLSIMETIEDALTKHLIRVIDAVHDKKVALEKIAPIIHEEVQSVLKYVNVMANHPRPALIVEDGVTKVGTKKYHTNTLRAWMFGALVEDHPTISYEDVEYIVTNLYPSVSYY